MNALKHVELQRRCAFVNLVSGLSHKYILYLYLYLYIACMRANRHISHQTARGRLRPMDVRNEILQEMYDETAMRWAATHASFELGLDCACCCAICARNIDCDARREKLEKLQTIGGDKALVTMLDVRCCMCAAVSLHSFPTHAARTENSDSSWRRETRGTCVCTR